MSKKTTALAKTKKPFSNSTPERNWLVLIDTVLLCILLVAICSQLNLGDIGKDTTAQGYVTKQLKIALPDIALLLNILWFGLRTTMLRAWKKLWWPPFPCFALVLTLIVSYLHSRPLINAAIEALGDKFSLGTFLKAITTKESKEAIAETLQFFGYFVLAPLLMVNLLHDHRVGEMISRRRIALWTFAVAIVFSLFLEVGS